MLEILINSKLLDLSDDIALTFTVENPMFSEDGSIPVPFATSIELPKTTNNLKILGFPNRIAVRYNAFTPRHCQILFDGIMLASGIFTIEEVSETINGSFSGSEILHYTKQKCNTLELYRHSLGYGPSTNTTSNSGLDKLPVPLDKELRSNYIQLDAYLIETKKMEEVADKPSPVVFAPIRIKSQNFNLENKVAYGNLRAMYINAFLPYNDYESLFLLGDRAMGSIQPAFRLGWLLDEIFDHSLDNNIFSQGELQKLVLQTLHHPTIREGAVGYPHNQLAEITQYGSMRYYKLADFLPELSRLDIVREILKIFCLSLYTEGGRFKLVHNDYIMNNSISVDLNKYDPEITSITKEPGKIYKYGYAGLTRNTPENYLRSSYPWMVWRHTAESYKEEVIYLTDTNQYISAKRSDELTQKWYYEVLDGGFGGSHDSPVDAEEGEKEVWDMTSQITPMDNSYHNVWRTDGHPNYPWPGKYEGLYYSLYMPEANGYTDKKAYPRIMMWEGYRSMSGTVDGSSITYPFMTAKNHDADGKRLGATSLEFDTPMGIFNRYHSEFAKWVERDKTVIEVELLITILFLSSLELYKKYLVETRLFYIRSLSVDIHKDYLGVATLDMVEA